MQSDSDSQVQACCIYPLVNRARDSLHNHRDDGETLAAERALEARQLENRDTPEMKKGQR